MALLPIIGRAFARGFSFRTGGAIPSFSLTFRSSGVQGGQRLARFLTGLRDLTPEEMAKIMVGIIDDLVLPELRSRTPQRTGMLKKSLRVTRRGAIVQLRGAFHGRFVAAIGSPQTTVAELAMDIIQARRHEIRARLIAAVKARLGI